MPQEILVVKNINKSFGKSAVLQGINLVLKEKEIFGLLGPNAAGKSTLAKIMIGSLKPDSGSVHYYGKELFSNKNEINKFIALVPQEEYFYRDFSSKRNLEFCGMLYGLKGKELNETVSFLLDWLNLKNFKDVTSSKLSGGYRRLLNMACSLVHSPKIVFMDEPTVGLDPKMRRIFWGKIRELRESGATIVLTTHYMDEAESLCDRIAFVMGGRILDEGNPSEIVKKYSSKDLEEAFLAATINKEGQQ